MSQFEIGKTYRHTSGTMMRIVGELDTYLYGRCLVGERSDDAGLHPVGHGEGHTDNWEEIAVVDGALEFPRAPEIPDPAAELRLPRELAEPVDFRPGLADKPTVEDVEAALAAGDPVAISPAGEVKIGKKREPLEAFATDAYFDIAGGPNYCVRTELNQREGSLDLSFAEHPQGSESPPPEGNFRPLARVVPEGALFAGEFPEELRFAVPKVVIDTTEMIVELFAPLVAHVDDFTPGPFFAKFFKLD